MSSVKVVEQIVFLENCNMSSKHKLQTSETNLLKQNIEEQLHRLLRQLNDLREEKDNLDPDEYEDMEKDTLDQLKEFQESLKKMVAGNLTLEDELSSVKMVRCLIIQFH